MGARSRSSLNRGDGTFGPRRGRRAADLRSIALRDLNGDGKPDVVTVSSDGGVVSVRLNRGDGGFRAKRDYQAGSVAVGIGDLNGDGALDVVAANRLSTVSVRLNRGNGRLRVARRYRTGLEPVSVALGDLNSDGKLDLVTANSEANTVSVLVNKGNGRFERWRDHAVGRGPMAVASVDVSGDGRPDIVSGEPRLGHRLGVGERRQRHLHGAQRLSGGGDPRSLTIGDIDGVGGSTSYVNAEASTGRCSPAAERELSAGGPFATGRHRPVSVAMGDLNRDGGQISVTANLEDDSVSVLLGYDERLFARLPDVIGSSVEDRDAGDRGRPLSGRTVEPGYSESVTRDGVSAEHPRAGTTLPAGGIIDIVLSDGPAPGRPGGLLCGTGWGSQDEVSSQRVRAEPDVLRLSGPARATTDLRALLEPTWGKTALCAAGPMGRAATVGGGPYSSEGARAYGSPSRVDPEPGARNRRGLVPAAKEPGAVRTRPVSHLRRPTTA